jgi:hypothetical protein
MENQNLEEDIDWILDSDHQEYLKSFDTNNDNNHSNLPQSVHFEDYFQNSSPNQYLQKLDKSFKFSANRFLSSLDTSNLDLPETLPNLPGKFLKLDELSISRNKTWNHAYENEENNVINIMDTTNNMNLTVANLINQLDTDILHIKSSFGVQNDSPTQEDIVEDEKYTQNIDKTAHTSENIPLGFAIDDILLKLSSYDLDVPERNSNNNLDYEKDRNLIVVTDETFEKIRNMRLSLERYTRQLIPLPNTRISHIQDQIVDDLLYEDDNKNTNLIQNPESLTFASKLVVSSLDVAISTLLSTFPESSELDISSQPVESSESILESKEKAQNIDSPLVKESSGSDKENGVEMNHKLNFIDKYLSQDDDDHALPKSYRQKQFKNKINNQVYDDIMDGFRDINQRNTKPLFSDLKFSSNMNQPIKIVRSSSYNKKSKSSKVKSNRKKSTQMSSRLQESYFIKEKDNLYSTILQPTEEHQNMDYRKLELNDEEKGIKLKKKIHDTSIAVSYQQEMKDIYRKQNELKKFIALKEAILISMKS